MTPIRRLAGLLAAAILVLAQAPAITGAATAATMRPILFVHGFMGSGSQFHTQAKRFAANGYPAASIDALDYDTTFTSNTRRAVYRMIDDRIAALKAVTGADKVELVGHSLGTSVSQDYLNSSAARAAGVAHYVNIDGFAADELPGGGVPTLAIWGSDNSGTDFPGATNVHLDQSHVETTGSPESFTAMYEFFTGSDPSTTQIVPQSGTIQLAGRVQRFPTNAALEGARVQVFAVNPATGRRTGQTPVATVNIGADGKFGPIPASGTASYEFLLTRADTDQVHHFYFPPFRRTDLGIRLLSSEPGSALDRQIDRDAAHVALLTYRDKEWWGNQGAQSDTLTINGTQIINARTTSRAKGAIGVFVFDDGIDRQSDVNAGVAGLRSLPFIAGTDLYMPASAAGDGTVTLRTSQRGAPAVQFAVPNWPASNHTVTFNFDDFVS